GAGRARARAAAGRRRSPRLRVLDGAGGGRRLRERGPAVRERCARARLRRPEAGRIPRALGRARLRPAAHPCRPRRAVPDGGVRSADAIRRGKLVCEAYGRDLFEVDYHELAERPLEDVRELLCVPPKSREAELAGTAGPFDEGGLSPFQREAGLRLAARDAT